MISIFLIATVFASRLVWGQSASNVTVEDVSQAFTTSGIVPDVLSSFDPTAILNVVFHDQATNSSIDVVPGMNLTTEQTLLEPQFFLSTNNTSFDQQTFVLVILDPDAPTPQNASLAQFRHLLAGDFHVNGSTDTGLGALLTNTSAALTEFVNPTPPAGSDPHRYPVLLFMQPANFSTVAPLFINASTPRSNFNLTTFAEEVGLGDPVAGNLFFTGPDNTTNTSATSSAAPTSSGSSGTTTPASGVVGKSVPYALALFVVFVVTMSWM
ncbi:PEBP-like protein [Obba rivulosa]|uniref:PEBP-like protein n=1 Tax=Obba rivulosa TaxID=1052685 RepID=A0A8E2B1K4_9APHY|nr:PEBP-like protein [Obba rivulosa]